MVLEPSITDLAKSIIRKLSGNKHEPVEILIEEQPKKEKLVIRQKTRITKKNINVFPKSEPQTIPTAEPNISIEEQESEKPPTEEIEIHLEEFPTEKVMEVSLSEPEQFEETETVITTSEQKEEPQPPVASASPEPEPKESDQLTDFEEPNPKYNLFQKLLQKLRPKDHS